MVEVQRHFLIVLLALGGAWAGAAEPPNFYSDDPLWTVPKPVPVGDVFNRGINALYDFLSQSGRPDPRPPQPALGVNTLGEVPDSAWFTNRHGRRRMNIAELRRGPGDSNMPVAPYVVVGAKTEGITPGFRMRDARGRLYFVKPDPISNPEMATAADVLGAKFFHAIGYNTPENYMFYVRRSELSISPKAEVRGAGGRPRPMTGKDIDAILDAVPQRARGEYRLMASLALEGQPVGPFRFEGVRTDDPNDTVPHERRRDLRGLHVFSAWLNHTDAKSLNSLDTIVERDGVRFIRHHLIDFGAMLGSDSDFPKNARNGNEYMIPKMSAVARGMFALGLYSPAWERARYPRIKSVGRLEAEVFDPEKWKPNYPNPAFLSRLPDDEYWAAKIVMAFTDEDIRAIVETGEYSDPAAVNHITRALAARRDKIGRAYLLKVLALDGFSVENGQLRFEDLAIRYDLAAERTYEVAWTRYDNAKDIHEPLPGEASFTLPGEMATAPENSYYAAAIRLVGDARKRVTVYLRKEVASVRVVGVERGW